MKGSGPPERTVHDAPVRGSRPRDIGFAITACAVLAAYNNLIGKQPWHHRRYVLLNLCATGAALSVAAASGLTAADLGFRRDASRPGLPATRLAAGVAIGWLLVAAVPTGRPVLKDRRIAGLNGRAIAYQAVIRIPIGTVLWEEVAFRGVLQAALCRIMSERAAIMLTSGVFGVWHVRPTLEALRVNGLTTNRKHAVARVFAGSATTAAGGVLLSWLRARSGSLTAPVLMHLSTNCGGLVAAWAVTRAPASGSATLVARQADGR
jgi:membrane protease YdiL (CAAX protease family)